MPVVWHAGWPSRIAATTTFLATLVLPIQAAVGLGVAISALLYVFSSSTDVSVVELVRRSDGRVEERTPPKRVPGGRVTVLDVYGHLFFAGARTLERLLPLPGEGRHPVVVLRLRGRRIFEATLVQVLSDYAKQLEAVDGRLYLTGLNERTHDEVERSGKFRLHWPVRAYEVTPILGQSTREAYDDAQAWLVGLREHPP
jgi:SulP family sulfate permease